MSVYSAFNQNVSFVWWNFVPLSSVLYGVQRVLSLCLCFVVFARGDNAVLFSFVLLRKCFTIQSNLKRKSPKNQKICRPNTFPITLNSNTFYNRNLDNYWYLRKFESKPLTHNNNNSIVTVFCFVFLINNHKFFFVSFMNNHNHSWEYYNNYTVIQAECRFNQVN